MHGKFTASITGGGGVRIFEKLVSFRYSIQAVKTQVVNLFLQLGHLNMQDIAIANGMQVSPEIEKREGLLIGYGRREKSQSLLGVRC